MIIFSNSPGEISSWVIPVVERFKLMHSDCHISICLTPCDYATGREYDILNQHSAIDHVYNSKETMSLCFFRKSLSIIAKKGAILYLGGDPMYPQLLKIRYRFPLYGYSEHKGSLGFLYKKTFNKHLCGDLMMAKFADRHFDRQSILSRYALPDQPYCLIMPGSRYQHFSLFYPIIYKTCQLIQESYPDFAVIICISSFITKQEFNHIQSMLSSSSNIYIFQEADSLELMFISRLMVSLPGTNTAEAFYMALPMLTIVPLNHPEVLIFDGISQLIFKIPVIGQLLRRLFIFILKRLNLFFALPNKFYKKSISPEMVGVYSSLDLVSPIVSLFYNSDELKTISDRFKSLKKDDIVDSLICKSIIDDI